MWRKGILLLSLVSSLLLAGAAEARQVGSSSNLVLGNIASADVRADLGNRRPPRARLDLAISADGEGEAGSIINPDGVRALGTTPIAAGRRDRSGWVRLAVDPHG